MGEDAGGLVEVARGSLEAIRVGAVAADGQLRVQGSQVEYDVGPLELEVVVNNGPINVVSQRRIPSKVGAYLCRCAIMSAPKPQPACPLSALRQRKEERWRRDVHL